MYAIAMDDTASLIVEPHMWTVEHRGIVKSTMSSRMPFFFAQAEVTGMVADEEQMENAVRYAEDMFQRHLNGFFLAMIPAMQYCMTR